jgi:hypothetical protein
MNTRMQCFWAFHELLRWSIELVVWVSILPLRCVGVGQKWRAMLIAIERLNDSFCPSVEKGNNSCVPSSDWRVQWIDVTV